MLQLEQWKPVRLTMTGSLPAQASSSQLQRLTAPDLEHLLNLSSRRLTRAPVKISRYRPPNFFKELKIHILAESSVILQNKVFLAILLVAGLLPFLIQNVESNSTSGKNMPPTPVAHKHSARHPLRASLGKNPGTSMHLPATTRERGTNVFERALSANMKNIQQESGAVYAGPSSSVAELTAPHRRAYQMASIETRSLH